jgi:hypothetical protein
MSVIVGNREEPRSYADRKGKCAGLLGVEKVVNISSLAFVREREQLNTR